VTVNVSPQATANGSVDAVVQLVTQAGNGVGTPEAFVIEATETGRVAWVIVIASGVVLAGMTVLRIRQVARAPRRKEGA
jgi:carbon monoxide dehydrogenase subunit G